MIMSIRIPFQFQVGRHTVAHVDVAVQSLHHAVVALVERVQPVHDRDVREVQVHRLAPVDQHILGVQQIDALDVRTRTEHAEAAVDGVLGRLCACFCVGWQVMDKYPMLVKKHVHADRNPLGHVP